MEPTTGTATLLPIATPDGDRTLMRTFLAGEPEATRVMGARLPLRGPVGGGTLRRGQDRLRVLATALLATLVSAAVTDPAVDPRLGEVIRLNDEGHFAEAEQAARDLLGQVEKEKGPDSLETARVLDVLTYALWHGGKEGVPETMALALRALEIRRQRLGPDDPDVAESMIKIGNLQYLNARYDEALALYTHALPIQERVFGRESSAVAGTLGNLGNVAADMGDLPQARRYYEQALELRRRLGPPHQTALTASNLGTILDDMADFRGAIDMYREALSIMVEASGPEHADVAIVLDNLANSLEEAGDLEEARELHERGLRIREKTLGPEHRLVGASMMNLGNTLRKMRLPAEARPLLEQALAIIQIGRAPTHPLVAAAMSSLADADLDLGDLSAARPLAVRALEIREARFGPDHPRVAQSLVQVSRLDAAEGRRAPALDQALRATSIIREAVLRAAPVLSEKEALDLATTLSSGLEAAIGSLGSGGQPSATLDVRRVWDALIRSRAIVLDEMAERHRAVLDSDRPAVARLATDREAARRRLARLLTAGPQVTGDPAYAKSLREARDAVDRSERALAEASAAYRDRWQGTGGDLAEVLRALPRASAIVGFAVSGPRYLAFVAGAGGTAVRVVDLGPRTEIDRLVGEWRKAVAEVPRNAADVAAYRKAGSSLRRTVWDPLATTIGDAGRVFLVPDGALHHVSFATLPVGEDKYLVEVGPTLHYLSAERDLVRTGHTPAPSPAHRAAGGLLVLGGPDFDGVPQGPSASLVATDGASPYRGALPDCQTFQSLRFEPLPGALAEAGELASLWRGTDRIARRSRGDVIELTSRAASEAALKRNAAGHAVLHLATHAFWMQGPCSGTGDPTKPGTKEGAATATPGHALRPRPLLLSGLALAGANRRNGVADSEHEDDGILTADEAASLDLRDVEWVVLSACQSGLGPVQTGEGVLGLRRAFQVAGAGTLILTLWPVSDQDTRDWMRELYTARLRGTETSSAMRAAARRVLNDRRRAKVSTHPFFWGAFVAAGDWR